MYNTLEEDPVANYRDHSLAPYFDIEVIGGEQSCPQNQEPHPLVLEYSQSGITKALCLKCKSNASKIAAAKLNSGAVYRLQ